jgi:hypothetical protein
MTRSTIDGGSTLQNGVDFLYGLATGIGSMPYLEAPAAIKLIKETLPYGPHWPQLPKLGKAEGFVRQYLSPLLRLKMVSWGEGFNPFFADQDHSWLDKVEKFYQLYLDFLEGGSKKEEVLSFFIFPEQAATGFYGFLKENWGELEEKPLFLKGQISGPLSVGLQLNAPDSRAAFYHDELREVLNKLLALISKAQIQKLKSYSLPVVIFIDEPALLSYGQSSYVSLSREAISASLEELILAIKEEGAYVGVHCCSGVDWSLLFELPFEIINFDAYHYFDSMMVYTEELNSFLQRGGCLGWGIVPTSAAIEKENTAALKKRFYTGVQRLARRGVDPELLVRQYLLTPSCGTGTLTIPQAERVYMITRKLQETILK